MWGMDDDDDDGDVGIEIVRRDNCLFVKNLVIECFYKIFIDWDIFGVI